MSRAAYRHIGGIVTTDHGPIRLADARALAAFYDREARVGQAAGPRSWAETCGSRALALSEAAAAAELWRRAAGWRDPDAADPD